MEQTGSAEPLVFLFVNRRYFCHFVSYMYAGCLITTSCSYNAHNKEVKDKQEVFKSMWEIGEGESQHRSSGEVRDRRSLCSIRSFLPLLHHTFKVLIYI